MASSSTRGISKRDVVDLKHKMEAQVWMETVLAKKLNGEFFDALQDGVVLCELLNKIKPKTCVKFKRSAAPFVARNNIQIFVNGAKKWGIPETDLFETRDLYDKQRLSAVVQTIYAVSAKSRQLGFKGPFIGVSYQDANKRYFSKAQLARAKSLVPLMHRSHKRVDVSSRHDSYGVIKNPQMSSMRFSSAQSVWQTGSKRCNTASNHDSYGVIKSKDLNQHSCVQSLWDKGSKNVNASTSSSYDAYGVIKTQGTSKHSNVQSLWDRGAKPVDVSSKYDAYGVIKTRVSTTTNPTKSLDSDQKEIKCDTSKAAETDD